MSCFLILLAILFRVGLVAFSFGSNDLATWQSFAEQIANSGLLGLYSKDSYFNHPPLGAKAVTVIFTFAGPEGFPFYFKLCGTLCDLLLALLIVGPFFRTAPQRGLWTLALYSWNPTTLLLSSFHGNTDPIWTALFVASLIMLRPAQPAFFCSGLLAGLALNVKLIPLVCLPALLIFLWLSGRGFYRYVTGLCCALLPFAAVAIMDSSGSLIGNIFFYKPFQELWGMALLLQIAEGLMQKIGGVQPKYLSIYASFAGSLILLTGALGALKLLWRLPRGSLTFRRALMLAVMSYLLFLLLTPGFGIQYLYPLPPFFFLISPRSGWWWSLACGFLLAAVYFQFTVSFWPWMTIHTSQWNVGSVMVGLLLWLGMLRALRQLLAEFHGNSEKVIVSNP